MPKESSCWAPAPALGPAFPLQCLGRSPQGIRPETRMDSYNKYSMCSIWLLGVTWSRDTDGSSAAQRLWEAPTGAPKAKPQDASSQQAGAGAEAGAEAVLAAAGPNMQPPRLPSRCWAGMHVQHPA